MQQVRDDLGRPAGPGRPTELTRVRSLATGPTVRAYTMDSRGYRKL